MRKTYQKRSSSRREAGGRSREQRRGGDTDQKGQKVKI